MASKNVAVNGVGSEVYTLALAYKLEELSFPKGGTGGISLVTLVEYSFTEFSILLG